MIILGVTAQPSRRYANTWCLFICFYLCRITRYKIWNHLLAGIPHTSSLRLLIAYFEMFGWDWSDFWRLKTEWWFNSDLPKPAISWLTVFPSSLHPGLLPPLTALLSSLPLGLPQILSLQLSVTRLEHQEQGIYPDTYTSQTSFFLIRVKTWLPSRI